MEEFSGWDEIHFHGKNAVLIMRCRNILRIFASDKKAELLVMKTVSLTTSCMAAPLICVEAESLLRVEKSFAQCREESLISKIRALCFLARVCANLFYKRLGVTGVTFI